MKKRPLMHRVIAAAAVTSFALGSVPAKATDDDDDDSYAGGSLAVLLLFITTWGFRAPMILI
jgi:hypothetical protein